MLLRDVHIFGGQVSDYLGRALPIYFLNSFAFAQNEIVEQL